MIERTSNVKRPPETPSPEDDEDRTSSRKQRLLAWLGLVVGVGALAAVTLQSGIDDIWAALAQGGFALVLLIAFYPLELFPQAEAWGLVFPPGRIPSRRVLAGGMWVSHSVNRLLPTATIGGDIVRGRLAILDGSRADHVVTSLVADKTAHAVNALAMLVLGGAVLLTRTRDPSLLGGVALITALLGIGVYLFIRLQRSSSISRLLDRLSDEQSSWLAQAGATAQDVECQLDQIYAKPRRFIIAVGIRVAANVALAAEVWAAAWLLGTPVSPVEAVALRVMGVAARGIAFVVWGGLGVQEGAFALLASFVGLSPSALVAISLATRVRELVGALPGVALWLAGEGIRAIRAPTSDASLTPTNTDSSP